MKRIYLMGLVIILCNLITGCNGQTKVREQALQYQQNNGDQPVGGPFENSEFTYYGIPKNVSARDTSPGWKEEGQKLLLTGIVYQRDGRTPAPGVLLYYYQTNTAGRYLHRPEVSRSMKPNEKGQTHGYIRGWVKTGADGKYFIYTIRPGSYPSHDEPAHVHVTIKEPNNLKEYYIDDFVFDDDKLLNTAKRRNLQNRAGSGILRLVQSGNMHIGERNLILGLNIPDYPDKKISWLKSGKNIGEDVFSFTPFHAWGPDKGTKTCPVCKYGWYDGILYFVGNHPDWVQIKQWLSFLETESRIREKYLKVYFVYGNEARFDKVEREKNLSKIGQELALEKVALTFVPSFTDFASEIYLNKINPAVENTFVLYKRSRIIDKFINLKPGKENFALIKDRLDKSVNEYFDLPKTKNG